MGIKEGFTQTEKVELFDMGGVGCEFRKYLVGKFLSQDSLFSGRSHIDRAHDATGIAPINGFDRDAFGDLAFGFHGVFWLRMAWRAA